jgi:hypothetical protein
MASINPDELNEKQQIELATAEAFLELYNRRKGTDYEPVEVGDTPDIRCQDNSGKKVLDLEITLLEDRPDDIAFLLGRVEFEDEFSISRVIDFKRDVIPRLKERLEDKFLSYYGERTALLIRQVGPLWSASDWQRDASVVITEVLKGREKNYGMGVWILCSNTSTNPISSDLFPLLDPEVGIIDWQPTIQPNERLVGKVSWENNITRDFSEFAERDDVDPIIRIESPHDCEYAILIAFISDEPEGCRQEAIEFYRNQMVFFCPCGRGNARMIGNWFATKM